VQKQKKKTRKNGCRNKEERCSRS